MFQLPVDFCPFVFLLFQLPVDLRSLIFHVLKTPVVSRSSSLHRDIGALDTVARCSALIYAGPGAQCTVVRSLGTQARYCADQTSSAVTLALALTLVHSGEKLRPQAPGPSAQW